MLGQSHTEWWVSALLDVARIRAGAATGLLPVESPGPQDSTTPHVPAQTVEALLQLNTLPSRQAHPERLETWAQAPAGSWPVLMAALRTLDDENEPGEAQARLHRYVSNAWRADPELALGWIEDLSDAALPLCLAPSEQFALLQQRAGWLILGPALRQVITHAERVHLQSALGTEGLDFVHRTAPRLWPGGAQSPRLSAQPLSQQVEGWGVALLGRALEAASEPVRRRGQLRLIRTWAQRVPDLPALLSPPQAALSMCLRLLPEADVP